MTVEQPRNSDGTWVSLKQHFEVLLGARIDAVYADLAHRQKALELQAAEIERRLENLNHTHDRAQEALHTFVSIEKYETEQKAEKVARELALKRIDEQVANLDKSFNQTLTAYITRADARQTEIETAIATSKAVAEAAERAAEDQGRKSEALIQSQHRKTNRNMALAGLTLTVIIAISNWIGSGVTP